MSELNGKVAIVTGSSRGIGEAIARRLAIAGAKVIVAARTVEVRDERLSGTIDTVADAIKAAGGEATGVATNLMKKEARENLVAAALDKYGRIDVLVNNGAILMPGNIVDYEERSYDRMMEILLKAPHHLCQLVLPGMIERGEGGSILNISSVAAKLTVLTRRSYEAVYGMAKAALEHYTTSLAAEIHEHGISVNSLSPNGVVATPGQMYARKYSQADLDAAEPVESVAEAAHALITADPKVITGKLCYSKELLKEFEIEPIDIGMPAPKPN
ncbi:MAG: SDR family NAD(P)-dependent oxidoreductase [Pseudomonadales bacterium]|jgi:NAD(P)-dependent dehydrogenase (short-subunit alcohol dehydrogenase family)|nr:SDR family NAD(P)-dependent oxidoreductase [Pseudomonadales bacterium]MDP7594461.1 SDR family NAD(P)-dependent oxidoreductase [Pseudomonadales bacterium]HJN50586.1 SDR family NAD(P)-dependent oxidoreductase [Pseudomonadales bacterium]|tara:strand:+ start:980 stop:1795 length:816 start_codon:yes stop_codon:yes gene_type:complete